jgi:alpha-glucuronidase
MNTHYIACPAVCPLFHRRRILARILFFVFVFQLLAGTTARAEDGYRLWLRYDPLPAQEIGKYRAHITSLVVPGDSPTQTAIRQELVEGCSGLLGQPVPATNEANGDGAVIVGTPNTSPVIAGLKLDAQLNALGTEGFLIRSEKINGHKATIIASAGDIGALYGTFHFLRLIQTLQPITGLNISDKPRLQLRVLDHWDNLDGSIERGYAGKSLWNWDALPGTVDPRLRDYARAEASIGINGAVLNNVNADSTILSTEYLHKTAAIAEALRPYGIHVYLSARFSAPIELGHLKTADPLDPDVVAWWKAKADEIYALIPDFGGFLVKANSEGQPGPQAYNRTHADGANMFAAALAPHGGVVIWRAFVYDSHPNDDRVAQAYDAFKPLDGQFATNALVQVKNGPLDFQPREPFSALFGAVPKTQLILELQVTQEYLGHANHLVFLAPMWKEVLDSDTYAKGHGSTVARVIDGSLFGQRITGIAGVANTGSDRNWTGHDFAQANWYAFGRLAWNPDLTSEEIAREWIHMTFTHDPQAVKTIARIMLGSREAAVNYMTPLGLTHQMSTDFHYGPQPWGDTRLIPDTDPAYYNRADTNGLGFDRTSTGSDEVSQYNSPLRDQLAGLSPCPDKYLLWFHHVPWDYQMRSGRTMWDELSLHYQAGVDWVRTTETNWDVLSGVIDPERHAAVAAKLTIQEHDAIWWHDACLLYFQTFSNLPFPAGVDKPQHTLQELMALAPPGKPNEARTIR